MSTHLIKVNDGSETRAVFNAATFLSAQTASGETISGQTGTTISEIQTGLIINLASNSLTVAFSSTTSVHAALAQIYTDMEDYYNQ